MLLFCKAPVSRNATDRTGLGVSQADDCPSPVSNASEETLERRIAVDFVNDVRRQVYFVMQRRADVMFSCHRHIFHIIHIIGGGLRRRAGGRRITYLLKAIYHLSK